MKKLKRIVITEELLLTRELNVSDKILLAIIKQLEKNGVCEATNKYFSDILGITKTQISFILSKLNKLGYIDLKIIYKPGTKQIDHRELKILKWGE